MPNERKHKYDRETVAYPFVTLKSYKYWTPVSRVDNVYGEKIFLAHVPQWMNIKKSRLKDLVTKIFIYLINKFFI